MGSWGRVIHRNRQQSIRQADFSLLIEKKRDSSRPVAPALTAFSTHEKATVSSSDSQVPHGAFYVTRAQSDAPIGRKKMCTKEEMLTRNAISPRPRTAVRLWSVTDDGI